MQEASIQRASIPGISHARFVLYFTAARVRLRDDEGHEREMRGVTQGDRSRGPMLGAGRVVLPVPIVSRA